MPNWNCYYHVVWATKNRELIITPINESTIFESIKNKAVEQNCQLLAINGISDHIHIAICIKPSLLVASWISQAKGASSHAVNVTFPDALPQFRWQSGYGVLTFGAKNLPFVLEYIANQKIHHIAKTTNVHLERMEDGD